MILRTFGPHSSTQTTLSGCFTILSNVLHPEDKLRMVPNPYFVSMCLSEVSLASSILIEFLILAIIDREDSYGYEISQTIKLVANIKESTLYPILKKLEKAGYMTTYSQAYQGRKRKYYSITQEGKEQLQFLNEEWLTYKETLDGIVEGRLRHDKD